MSVKLDMWLRMWLLLVLSLLLVSQTFPRALGQMPDSKYGNFEHFYQPIRIVPFYKNLNFELNHDDAQTLKDTVHNVILYIKKILSVLPVQDPLLLGRDACRSSWIEGRNAGKCANIKKGYRGEFCLDSFKIPDEHLEGFYTWTNKPLPGRTWFMEGNGVKNSDYLLYVQASTTQSCMSNFKREEENSLIAYASFCKLGRNDRPTAGYINFCPSEFTSYKNDKDRLILATIHEVFHALGFSKDLFYKFRDCSMVNNGEECPKWGFPIIRKSGSLQMMVTPTVVREMQKHFSCNENDFGGPLYVKDGMIQSHWDSELLSGSVMTPKLGRTNLTFIDPVTLAVFQDSGWYRVNFSNADNYLWGKEQGCQFIKSEYDHNRVAGCSVNIETSGCNYFYTHTIKCDSLKSHLPGISYFENCHTNQTKKDTYSNGLGRCFLSNLTSTLDSPWTVNSRSVQTFKGTCLSVKCFPSGTLQIKVNNSDWINCPLGEQVKVPSYGGVVMCPKTIAAKDMVCFNRDIKPLYLQDLYRTETTTVTVRPVVRIVNTTPKYIYQVKPLHKNVSNLAIRDTCDPFIHVYSVILAVSFQMCVNI